MKVHTSRAGFMSWFILDVCSINHGNGVFNANIQPDTEVGGTIDTIPLRLTEPFR